jgi:hypothetical protein
LQASKVDAQTKAQKLKNFREIPGVGESIALNLWDIGIRRVEDLKGSDAEEMYDRSNILAGCTQDRCLLYVFRCAVYYANTSKEEQENELLKWWNWKDKKSDS